MFIFHGCPNRQATGYPEVWRLFIPPKESGHSVGKQLTPWSRDRDQEEAHGSQHRWLWMFARKKGISVSDICSKCCLDTSAVVNLAELGGVSRCWSSAHHSLESAPMAPTTVWHLAVHALLSTVQI